MASRQVALGEADVVVTGGVELGNLIYRKTARNFGPIMAAAATTTIVQVEDVVPVGALDPEIIVTPCIYIDRIVRMPAPARAPEPDRGGPVSTKATGTTLRGLSKDDLAARVARDILRGAFVNLSIGLPTRISNHLPPDSGVR